MATNMHRRPDAGDDGVRIVRTPGVRSGVWFLIAAMTAVGIAVLLVARPALQVHHPPPARRAGAIRDSGPGAHPSRAGALARAETGRDGAPRPSRHAAPGAAEPDASGAPSDPSTAADAAGDMPGEIESEERSGIALFPPPGTEPLKSGIIVPEDFDLPPGYVRHHQVTDKGDDLPPILMFHHDYQPKDAHGDPIPLPADRIVPPEMAPPGLPIDILQPPDDAVPMMEVPEGQAAQDSAP